MTAPIDPDFHACAETVRRHDTDRYLTTLFAPAPVRPHLLALYAFNFEVARVAETVREPMLGAIRLEWWRETLQSAREGRPRNHEVARAMARVMAAHDIPPSLFDALLDARGFDSTDAVFPDRAALESYCDATSGNLMRIAARIVGAGEALDAMAHEAGIAYAIAGLLRAMPFHAARHKTYLPADLMAAVDFDPPSFFAARDPEKLRAMVRQMGLYARDHFLAARRMGRPGPAFAAILPAALVPLYVRRIARCNLDIFRHPPRIPVHRRQMSLLTAALKGRL